ncbi:hypothetical protein Tco_0535209 [Tanacetum coccineum]
MGDENLSNIPEKRIGRNDDDSFEDIDYVEALPLDTELVNLEEAKDDILCEKFLNINLLTAKIESLNDNPTPDCVLKSPSPFPIPIEDSDSFFEKSDTSLSYFDNSLPEFETLSDHTKETSSGSTTTHADNSLPEYDSFLFEIKPDQGELTSVVMEDSLGEPSIHVPNVLPTHPTLMLDSDFIPSDDSLGSDLEVSFPSGTRNKIFDPGIFFEGIIGGCDESRCFRLKLRLSASWRGKLLDLQPCRMYPLFSIVYQSEPWLKLGGVVEVGEKQVAKSEQGTVATVDCAGGGFITMMFLGSIDGDTNELLR